MKRADRRDENYDNAIKFPHGQRKEPIPRRDLEQRFLTVQSQRDEWQKKAKENEAAVSQLVHLKQQFETVRGELVNWKNQAQENHQLYLEQQKKYQTTIILYNEEKNKTNELLVKYDEANAQKKNYVTLYETVQGELIDWKNQAQENHQLYLEQQEKYQTTITLYNEEKNKASELLVKYNEANTQKETYLTLYNETKEELKYERRSKASIKGWNTRRKKENEKLKQEIGQMTILLKDSLERKEDAINNLYIMAERMDRIQDLVDSVEGESDNTPGALLDKLKRIWTAIKDILAE